MKRFLGKAGRFFWSGGFLKFLLWAVTLVILFYTEEDWRGARAWADAKARGEANGETFDPQKLAPPAIPDSENLGAISLFQDRPSKPGLSSEPLALKEAMRQEMPGGKLPRALSSPTGVADLNSIRRAVGEEFRMAFPNETVPVSALDQFEALYPFIGNLLAASVERPLCRLPADYSTAPPAARPLGLITAQIRLSQILTVHALLALDERQAHAALTDIGVIDKLLSGVQRDPTLIAGLVAIAMEITSDAALEDGLNQHRWSDNQLAELEQSLERFDFLASYQFAMKGEASFSTANIDFFREHQRHALRAALFQIEDSRVPVGIRLTPFPWPTGWWDDNKARLANFLFDELTTVNPAIQRAYPSEEERLRRRNESVARAWDAGAPWKIWFALAAPALQATSRFAYAQTLINEARIACGLERYRLARGAYPSSLAALVPQDIATLPHDVINGQPYRYRLRPDGTFLLYSVGWDETDDGGAVVYRKDAPRAIDQEHGDWVWPTPK